MQSYQHTKIKYYQGILPSQVEPSEQLLTTKLILVMRIHGGRVVNNKTPGIDFDTRVILPEITMDQARFQNPAVGLKGFQYPRNDAGAKYRERLFVFSPGPVDADVDLEEDRQEALEVPAPRLVLVIGLDMPAVARRDREPELARRRRAVRVEVHESATEDRGVGQRHLEIEKVHGQEVGVGYRCHLAPVVNPGNEAGTDTADALERVELPFHHERAASIFGSLDEEVPTCCIC